MSKLIDPDNYESNKPKLPTGAIIGSTTYSSCRLWIRVYKPGIWWLVVTEKPIEGDLYRLEEKEVEDYLRDHNISVKYKESYKFNEKEGQTHAFNVTGLRSNTRYYYALIADKVEGGSTPRRTEIGSERHRWFKTLERNPSSITFGFYSCHDPFSRSDNGEGAWSHFYQVLKDRDADFVIGGGDQIYVDTNSSHDMQDIWKWLKKNKRALINQYSDSNGKIQEDKVVNYFVKLYRKYYRVYWYFPHLMYVYERFPQYMIWDDHEIMDGWGSLTWDERASRLNRLFEDDEPEENKLLVKLMFRAARQVYYEYQHSHNPVTSIDLDDNSKSVWDYGFSNGPFAFYVMDMRGHHDYENPPNRLLGDDQQKRFNKWLDKKSTEQAKALFIVSPVPVVHWDEFLANHADIGSVKDDLRDQWVHESNHDERNSILDKLFERSHKRAQTVLFLSGDAHNASVYQLYKTGYGKAKIFHVTSSAISRKPSPKLSTVVMQQSGPIPGYENGRSEQLYRFSGRNNFVVISAKIVNGELDVAVDLYWPDGDEQEVVQKKINFTNV
ncbi:MAG: alkaline phosphatase family protein [Planctomycetes bacterium]|nr:alkaline phosphatase family protein [Planctomycetota bacterium]